MKLEVKNLADHANNKRNLAQSPHPLAVKENNKWVMEINTLDELFNIPHEYSLVFCRDGLIITLQ